MKRHHALAAIVLAALAVVGAVLFVVPRFAADPAGPAEMAGAPQPFEVVVGRHRKSQGNLAIEWLAEVIKSVSDLAMPR